MTGRERQREREGRGEREYEDTHEAQPANEVTNNKCSGGSGCLKFSTETLAVGKSVVKWRPGLMNHFYQKDLPSSFSSEASGLTSDGYYFSTNTSQTHTLNNKGTTWTR